MFDLSLTSILVVIGVLLVSMAIHEAMHAYVALKLGDDTAAEEGRISLNPFKHIDPFMTVILPAITLIVFQVPILAAKPVPFNPDRVKWDEYGAALVAAAGPLSNLAVALITAVVAGLTGVFVGTDGGLLSMIFYTFITLNVSLFVFNLIPIPPLDGSRVLYAFAPEPVQNFMRAVEPYGFIVVITLVLIGGFGDFIFRIIDAVLQVVLRLT